jgi:hypothetical protein
MPATDLPEPRGPVKEGDLWCKKCAWLLAREMLQEDQALDLAPWLHCPTHR